MQLKCPACGAVHSLDCLVNNEAASQALNLALSLNGELGRALIGYLGLFRPLKTALSFDRVARLLGEILPDIEQESIERGGQRHPAPRTAWIYALNETINQRHQLKLPLKSHGYLYEIISQSQARWQSVALAQPNTGGQKIGQISPPAQSKTVSAIEGYAQWLNN